MRAQVVQRIHALDPAERLEKSARAAARLLAHTCFQGAATVLSYDSADTEPGTEELNRACLRLNKRLAFPRTRKSGRTLSIHAVQDLGKELEMSRFGFREPAAGLPRVTPGELDLIVVPGVAFDAQGRRLGRGGGYYDRFLARPKISATICALAFDCQIVEAVPALAHDRCVQLIFTESRTIEAPGTVEPPRPQNAEV